MTQEDEENTQGSSVTNEDIIEFIDNLVDYLSTIGNIGILQAVSGNAEKSRNPEKKGSMRKIRAEDLNKDDTPTRGGNAELFRNRKGYFSLNVQVVCDHNLKDIDIIARWPESVHDATIIGHSNLSNRMEQNQFHSGVLLGNSGYPIKNYLLTPVRNSTTPAEECYNDRHIRTQNTIERFFGVWKRRFPVLSIGMRVKLETVQDIIVATAVLQNWARDQHEEEPPVLDEINNEYGYNVNMDLAPNRPEQLRDNTVRQALINEYFSRLDH